jgi:hypothetical protein
MNIASYVRKHNSSMTSRKRKQLIRKVVKKLATIQPRILEAKLLDRAASNKIFTYRKTLESTLDLLNNKGPVDV